MRTLWDFRSCWRGSAGPCGHGVTSHIEAGSAIRVHRRHVTEPHGYACGRHPDCSETGLTCRSRHIRSVAAWPYHLHRSAGQPRDAHRQDSRQGAEFTRRVTASYVRQRYRDRRTRNIRASCSGNAVQNVGHRTAVYVAGPREPGRFTKLGVRIGKTSGEQALTVSFSPAAAEVTVL